jgi:alkylhydroperoxidase/carboxymuconolactone decarboxylase family protein YurZ
MHTTTGDGTTPHGITPDALADEFTLTTAATRLDFLSRRDSGATALNVVHDPENDGWAALKATDTSLDVSESLELLALGEVVARKAHGSRLVGIRAALRGGASWEEIAAALAVTPQQAWDTFSEAITREAAGDEPDAGAAAAARELAGSRPRR